MPRIPTVSKPLDTAAIAIIDIDPLKQSMPLWHIKARRCYRADGATALAQLNARLDRVDIDHVAPSAAGFTTRAAIASAKRSFAASRRLPEMS